MPDPNWSIGIDIGGTKVFIACVDHQGAILDSLKYPTEAHLGPRCIIQNLVEAVSGLIAKSSTPPQSLGVGIAGQIVAETGAVAFSPNLDNWRDIPLKALLSQALHLPISIDNDVRAAAYGEWQHGAGRGCRDLACLFIGTGIGGGIISGGKMLTGAANCAGELGHMTLLLDGPVCTCGNLGCLEALASGWALARSAQRAVRENPGGEALLEMVQGDVAQLAASHLIEAASKGDKLASSLIEEAIHALIGGSIAIVNALNPERLVLGGGLGLALPHLVERIQEGVDQRALKAAARHLTVLPAELGNSAGVIGAAALSRTH